MSSISVVIPSFNRPHATWRAILSALGQTIYVREILVIDDASNPPLEQAELEKLDTRVKVHRLAANMGAAGARQAGIDLATGDIVAFLDSDDTWAPGKLAAQLPLLERGEMCAVACGWNEIDAEGRFLRTRIPIGADRPGIFAGGCWFCPGSTVIIARATLKRIGRLDPDLRRLEDFDWFLRFALAGGRLNVSHVIGADIAVGSRAKILSVKRAAETITAKFAYLGLAREDLKTIHAWLDVERARAARNERYIMRAAFYLTRSWLLKPRPRIHLRQWWKIS